MKFSWATPSHVSKSYVVSGLPSKVERIPRFVRATIRCIAGYRTRFEAGDPSVRVEHMEAFLVAYKELLAAIQGHEDEAVESAYTDLKAELLRFEAAIEACGNSAHDGPVNIRAPVDQVQENTRSEVKEVSIDITNPVAFKSSGLENTLDYNMALLEAAEARLEEIRAYCRDLDKSEEPTAEIMPKKKVQMGDNQEHVNMAHPPGQEDFQKPSVFSDSANADPRVSFIGYNRDSNPADLHGALSSASVVPNLASPSPEQIIGSKEGSLAMSQQASGGGSALAAANQLATSVLPIKRQQEDAGEVPAILEEDSLVKKTPVRKYSSFKWVELGTRNPIRFFKLAQRELKNMEQRMARLVRENSLSALRKLDSLIELHSELDEGFSVVEKVLWQDDKLLLSEFRSKLVEAKNLAQTHLARLLPDEQLQFLSGSFLGAGSERFSLPREEQLEPENPARVSPDGPVEGVVTGTESFPAGAN